MPQLEDYYAVSATGQQSMVERSYRPRTLKGGIISYHENAISFACVVRDVTEVGAKISVEPDSFVPNSFRLSIPVDGIKVECEARWRDGNHIGVLFTSEPEHDRLTARKQVMNADFVSPRKTSLRRK